MKIRANSREDRVLGIELVFEHSVDSYSLDEIKEFFLMNEDGEINLVMRGLNGRKETVMLDFKKKSHSRNPAY